MSVVIKRAPGWEGEGADAGCPRGNTAPTLEPVPIEDSCGADEVVIEAAIRDAETKISDAFLSYSWHGDPGNFPCYISASLLPGEEHAWISSIPSASALVGQEREGCDPIDPSRPVRFYYYLCAWDSDDPQPRRGRPRIQEV